MRAVVAKRLRREAREQTWGMLANSWHIRYRSAPFTHGDQTTRATYRRLKSAYRVNARLN